MAKQPVFTICEEAPFYKTVSVEYVFNPGFSGMQKQKNVIALHESYKRMSGENPLEISTKSLQPEGVALSAFNLMKYVPSLERSITVECAYQGSKVFEEGGPFRDLYSKSSKEAKKDERLTTSGRVIAFNFEDEEYESFPVSCFYDWLYIRTLLENPRLSEKLLSYSSFTDIEFNPEKSINCQARAAAIFVSLSRATMLHQTEIFANFRGMFLEGEKV